MSQTVLKLQEQRERQLRSFCAKINYYFENILVLDQALTHSTYAYEHQKENLTDNERLEFLGDAVLDLVISEELYRNEDKYAEGFMTKTRALVVCEHTLSEVAADLRVGDYLLLGKGETATGGREKASNLSNAMEAVIGAIFIDGGFKHARDVTLNLLESYLELALKGEMIYDYKSKLLEMVQATRGHSTMKFDIIDEQGPVHDRTFTAVVIVDGNTVAKGRGNSKKEAEQQAAKVALRRLSCNKRGCRQIDEQEEKLEGEHK